MSYFKRVIAFVFISTSSIGATAQISRYTFSSIAPYSSECALIIGTNEYKQTVSIDLCNGTLPKLKKIGISGVLKFLEFHDNANGYALGGGKLFRIDELKISQVSISISKLGEVEVSQFSDINNGCFADIKGRVACTSDGAKTFIDYGGQHRLRPIDIATNDRMFVLSGIGDNSNQLGGVVSRIGYLGKGETKLLDEKFVRVIFPNSKCDGFGLDINNRLMASVDCGENWSNLMQFSKRPDDIFFLDGTRGWVLNQELSHSGDGGRTWKVIARFPKDEIFERSSIAFANPMIGWILGMNQIYETTDGGITWRKVVL